MVAVPRNQLDIVANYVSKNVQSFQRVMRQNLDQFNKSRQVSNALNRSMGNQANIGTRLAQRFRMMTHGARGFKMELLSVMFFGMQIQRTFMGLMKTSMGWMGVTKILSTALGILFLPIAEIMLEWALLFLNWVTKLPKSTKEAIGMFVLLAAIFGTLLFFIGVVGLGIGGLIIAFGALLSPTGLLLGALVALGTAAAIKFLPDLFSNIGDKAKDADEKLAQFGITGKPIRTLAEKMKENMPKILDFFNMLKEKVKTKFKELAIEISEKKELWNKVGLNLSRNIFEGIKNFIKSNPLIVVGAMIGFWFGGPVGAMIGAAIGGIFGSINIEKMPQIIDTGFEALQGMLDGLSNNMDKVESVIIQFITKLGEFLGNNAFKLIGIGLKIMGSIIEGLIKGALSIGFGIGKTILEAMGMEDVKVPSFQSGGIMPHTGLAMLHKGERVIPAGETNNTIAPNITVNATVSNDMDVRRLAEQLKREWVNDFERLTQRRGSA